jgi:hypothetical protein
MQSTLGAIVLPKSLRPVTYQLDEPNCDSFMGESVSETYCLRLLNLGLVVHIRVYACIVTLF